MKIKLRTDMSEEERFLLKIKYGTDLVSVSDIHVSDYKYFEKLGRGAVYKNIGLITEQMAGLIDFDSFDGDLWDRVLRQVPEFGIYCNWNKLNGADWAYLLRDQPQFAEHCVWDEINGVKWVYLLQRQPQFAEHCNWDKLNESNWRCLLLCQPHLSKYRK